MKIFKYILLLIVTSGCSGVDHTPKSISNQKHDTDGIHQEHEYRSTIKVFQKINQNFELGRDEEALRALSNIIDDERYDNYTKARASLKLAKYYENTKRFLKAVEFFVKYSSSYYELTPEETDRFDFIKENGSLVLIRSANIAENKLVDLKLAENIYLKAVGVAEKNDRSHLYYIYEELGDYYLRRSNLAKANIFYKKSHECPVISH